MKKEKIYRQKDFVDEISKPPIPPNDIYEDEIDYILDSPIYTCETCCNQDICEWAFDSYCIYGDCLALK